MDVWVHMPPSGKPQRCREESLGYALSLGYKQCEKPKEGAAPIITVAPEPVVRRRGRPPNAKAEDQK